jgi:N,N'-diacetyllegionaminate synthase
MDLCRKMIDKAKECGADAVKFQSWSKDSLISKQEYARNTEYADKHRHFGSLEDMVNKYQFTPVQHHEIAAYCDTIDIHFVSSAFSTEEIDLLESLDIPYFKVASMDINNIKLLEYIGSKMKPVMLSTGMATLGEIERAINVLRHSGSGHILLLHCISIYPPEYEDIHLRNILTLQQTFDCAVGFSDHSIGTSIPLAAIALGACVIEKHFTLDKNMAGWDHWISAEPHELTTITCEGKHIFKALGSMVRTVTKAEIEKRIKFRRRIVLKKSMAPGEILTENDIDFKRPGNGIHPDEWKYVVGRKIKHKLESKEELSWDDLE